MRPPRLRRTASGKSSRMDTALSGVRSLALDRTRAFCFKDWNVTRIPLPTLRAWSMSMLSVIPRSVWSTSPTSCSHDTPSRTGMPKKRRLRFLFSMSSSSTLDASCCTVLCRFVGLRSLVPVFLVCCAVHPHPGVKRAAPLTSDEVWRQGCAGYWRTAVS